MSETPKKAGPMRWGRAVLEMAFILFLFYSNLLMGEFTHRNGRGRSLLAAFEDLLTGKILVIGLVCASAGFAGYQYLRGRLAR